VVGRAPRRRRPTRQRGGREYEAAIGGVYPVTESVDSHETQNIRAASESQIGNRHGDCLVAHRCDDGDDFGDRNATPAPYRTRSRKASWAMLSVAGR
jgi:hypothetical protein